MSSGKAADSQAVVGVLLDRCGRTIADEAGITLADKPGPLYQLLVLANLLSAPIGADIAVAAARELFAAGYRTPQAMRDASWQARVDALGRGRYRRYDERTATMLGRGAELLIDRWDGDLRKLRSEARGDTRRIGELLTELSGIGPSGAGIFLREAQAVWPEVAPYLDKKVLDGARKVGLPAGGGELAELAGSAARLAQLAAALIRVSRGTCPADEVLQAAAG